MIIYKTTNLINGMIYIGKATGKNITNGYLGSGINLKTDITKCGEKFFVRKTIDVAQDKKEQRYKEIFWIAFYREKLGRGSVYNIHDGALGGDTFTNNPNIEKIKKKISVAMTGKPAWNKNIPQTEEHNLKNKITHSGARNYMHGKTYEELYGLEKAIELKKMRADICSKTMLGKPSPRKGKKLSEEHKKKLRKPKNKGQNNPNSRTNREKRVLACANIL